MALRAGLQGLQANDIRYLVVNRPQQFDDDSVDSWLYGLPLNSVYMDDMVKAYSLELEVEQEPQSLGFGAQVVVTKNHFGADYLRVHIAWQLDPAAAQLAGYRLLVYAADGQLASRTTTLYPTNRSPEEILLITNDMYHDTSLPLPLTVFVQLVDQDRQYLTDEILVASSADSR